MRPGLSASEAGASHRSTQCQAYPPDGGTQAAEFAATSERFSAERSRLIYYATDLLRLRTDQLGQVSGHVRGGGPLVALRPVERDHHSRSFVAQDLLSPLRAQRVINRQFGMHIFVPSRALQSHKYSAIRIHNSSRSLQRSTSLSKHTAMVVAPASPSAPRQ